MDECPCLLTGNTTTETSERGTLIAVMWTATSNLPGSKMINSIWAFSRTSAKSPATFSSHTSTSRELLSPSCRSSGVAAFSNWAFTGRNSLWWSLCARCTQLRCPRCEVSQIESFGPVAVRWSGRSRRLTKPPFSFWLFAYPRSKSFSIKLVWKNSNEMCARPKFPRLGNLLRLNRQEHDSVRVCLLCARVCLRLTFSLKIRIKLQVLLTWIFIEKSLSFFVLWNLRFPKEARARATVGIQKVILSIGYLQVLRGNLGRERTKGLSSK